MTWLRFPRLLGMIVCLYLMAMSVLFGSLTAESSEFVQTAAATQGTVIRLETKAAAGSNRQPRPDSPNGPEAPEVRYVVDGTPFTYVAAHGEYRQRLQVGDTVTVLYDPAHPARARLRGEGRVLLPLITAAFVTAALLVAAALVATRRGWPLRARTDDRRRTGVAD